MPSLRGKDAAYDVGVVVPGVDGVINHLEVHYPKAHLPTDEQIEEMVRSVLHWDPDVDSEIIRVRVRHGIVTLEGEVPGLWQKAVAERDAGAIVGVMGVENRLVTIASVIEDEQIDTDVRTLMEHFYAIPEDQVSVEVHDGVVHLRGTVENIPVRESFVEAVRYTPGVIDVVDEVSVSG